MSLPCGHLGLHAGLLPGSRIWPAHTRSASTVVKEDRKEEKYMEQAFSR